MADEALRGSAQLIRQLQALQALENGSVIRKCAKAGAAVVVEAAEKRIPVGIREHKTYKGKLVQGGFAKSTVHAEVHLANDKQDAVALIGPSKEAYYATQFVERGTSKMKAEPWLVPAFFESKDEALAQMVASLQASVSRIVKTTT